MYKRHSMKICILTETSTEIALPFTGFDFVIATQLV